MTDEFCCEIASALAVLLLELNADLEDFAEQIDENLTVELEHAC